jgi:branched-chain amino acid transport system substrate-binding protein
MRATRLGLTMAAMLLAGAAEAQTAAPVKIGPVKIGMLTNETGIGAASGGAGTVYAARMAVADFGGKVLGRPIELTDADFAMKPDTAAGIARKWLDEGYDVIADVAMSAAALNVADMSKAAKKIYLATSPLTSDLTSTHCSPYTVHWGADSYVLASSVPKAVMQNGGDKWFFITVDYALGQALERDTTTALEKLGGKVVGSVHYPIDTTDFAQYVVKADGSGANVIAMATASDMLVNNTKQAHEFGLPHPGQKLVAPLLQQSDLDALGIDGAQGLSAVVQFYWDESDQSRAFSERFRAKMGVMPGNQHADAYAAVMHYLKAVQAAGTTDSDAVMAKMKALPVDYFGKSAQIRADGRLTTIVDVYEVKKPAEARNKFDTFRVVGHLAPEDVYRPMLPACDFAAK